MEGNDVLYEREASGEQTDAEQEKAQPNAVLKTKNRKKACATSRFVEPELLTSKK